MNKNMIEFLVGTYFGDVNDDNIYEKCIHRAYKDLARRIPYKYSVEMLEIMQKNDEAKCNHYKELKSRFIAAEFDYLKEHIDKCEEPGMLIEGVIKKASFYNNVFKESKKFCYGLAQKWVNMTLKYLWLFDKCPIEEQKLHAPLDSYIISALTDDGENNKYGLGIEIGNNNYVKLKNINWSTLEDLDFYNSIQVIISKAVCQKDFEGIKSRIAWETVAWMEQARLEAD